jgi:protein SCO1/2
MRASLASCLWALLVIAGCGRSGSHTFDPHGLAGPLIDPPLPKPELLLRDTDGARFDLQKETEGFLTLLFFGYTHCPDLCPVQMANLAAAMKRMDPKLTERMKVVFVTVDPRRDTPPVIRSWLDHFDHRFIGLTGDSASIAWAFTQLRLGHPMAPVPVRGDSGVYTVNHTVLVLAFTGDNLAHVAYPSGIRVDDWVKDLTHLAKGL